MSKACARRTESWWSGACRAGKRRLRPPTYRFLGYLDKDIVHLTKKSLDTLLMVLGPCVPFPVETRGRHVNRSSKLYSSVRPRGSFHASATRRHWGPPRLGCSKMNVPCTTRGSRGYFMGRGTKSSVSKKSRLVFGKSRLSAEGSFSSWSMSR